MAPILAQIGLDVGFFLGGVVVVEGAFSWPSTRWRRKTCRC